jgi:hypothetical protein
MIPQQLSQKRPGGRHTIEHLSLGILPARLQSSIYHREPPMIHSHSSSTFTTAEAGGTASLSFQASSADSMKQVPSIVLFSEHFYGAIPRRGSHGNFPLNTNRMVTPGTTRTSLSFSLSQLNGTRAGGST